MLREEKAGVVAEEINEQFHSLSSLLSTANQGGFQQTSELIQALGILGPRSLGV